MKSDKITNANKKTTANLYEPEHPPPRVTFLPQLMVVSKRKASVKRGTNNVRLLLKSIQDETH